MFNWEGFIEPEIDPDTKFFWDSVAENRLLLRHCDSCGRASLPPTVGCPYCASTAWHPVEAGGKGKLYSWVVCHRAMEPLFERDVPYTIVAVELEEGARLYGRLVNDDVELRDGMQMEVTFVDAGPDKRRFYAFRAIPPQ